ncbi:hypothetical protein L208DRAFT_1366422 [Tricholoma matsutake]|nr:hypothetical protein L208DRAFT_1366422 [Tricholoma matsutake 945]
MRQNGNLRVKPKAEMIDGIGVSLLKLLKKEYGDEYRAGRSVEEAKMAMKEINPHLENQNPREALQALKTQFKAYLTGAEPFDRKCGQNEFLHDYWCCLLDNEESDVLAVLAVKIFSAVPVSMVDERTMSVVTWLNSPRWKRQQVPTMANHLIIHGFNQLDQEEKL